MFYLLKPFWISEGSVCVCVAARNKGSQTGRAKGTSYSPQAPYAVWGPGCHSLSMVTLHGQQRHSERATAIVHHTNNISAETHPQHDIFFVVQSTAILLTRCEGEKTKKQIHCVPIVNQWECHIYQGCLKIELWFIWSNLILTLLHDPTYFFLSIACRLDGNALYTPSHNSFPRQNSGSSIYCKEQSQN